jgi:hypothetical protein
MSLNDDNRKFSRLLEALEAGWEIEEPVLSQMFWSHGTNVNGVYHVVLHRTAKDEINLLNLPPSRQLLNFLTDHQISVTPI